MRRIVISGLVAVAAVLGGVAVPAAAMARPTAAVRADGLAAMRTPRTALAADEDEIDGAKGAPMISCVLATDCVGVEGSSISSDGIPPPRLGSSGGTGRRGSASA